MKKLSNILESAHKMCSKMRAKLPPNKTPGHDLSKRGPAHTSAASITAFPYSLFIWFNHQTFITLKYQHLHRPCVL